MARYQATVDTPRPPAQTFAYLSDFTTAPEWDPGTVQFQRLGEGPIGEGTEFRLVAVFLGRKTTLTYCIVEHQPPHAVTFRGENSTVVSRDRITFEASDGGTRIVYDPALTLKGLLKLADPLLALAFGRVGDRAAAGLRNTTGTQQAGSDRWTAHTKAFRQRRVLAVDATVTGSPPSVPIPPALRGRRATPSRRHAPSR